MRQRPESFLINQGHSLARGLVFAGLGQSPGSVRYKDSSSRRNDGVLTSMDPSTDWCWVPELGRWGLDFDGSNQYVSVPAASMSGDAITVCAWMRCQDNDADQRLINHTSDRYDTYTILLWGDDECHSGVQGVDNTDTFMFNYGNTNIAGNRVNGSSGARIVNTWQHVMGVMNGACRKLYLDGVLHASHSSGSQTTVTNPTVAMKIGQFLERPSPTCQFTDVLIMLGDCGYAAPKLANPSNVMLSGLIRPPKRKYYVIKYHPTTARLLMLKQNNRFLSLQKI